MRVTGSPGGLGVRGQERHGPGAAGLSGAAAGHSPALEVANRLRDELALHGITAGVHVGYGVAFGVAVLSVGADLLVWVEYGPGGCWSYVWWTGRTNPATGRRIYTWCPRTGVSSVARRIAARHSELREQHPRPPLSAERRTPAGSNCQTPC